MNNWPQGNQSFPKEGIVLSPIQNHWQMLQQLLNIMMELLEQKTYMWLMITQNVCRLGTQRCEFGLSIQPYDFSKKSLSLSLSSVIHFFKIYVQAKDLFASSLSCLAHSTSNTRCGKFQPVKYYELQLLSYFNSLLKRLILLWHSYSSDGWILFLTFEHIFSSLVNMVLFGCNPLSLHFFFFFND